MSASNKPEILAPAGGRDSFLAALAAGADAVYCGLKRFSARMEAENFDIDELSRLVELSHEKGRKVYVALNSVIKQDEIVDACRIVGSLARNVKPDALIIQDLGLVPLARQEGFGGEIHLSTLSAVTFSAGLAVAGNMLGVKRVVLPREFSIEEIKGVASNCPHGLDLEVFVHGALCYGVSGRCYWSSFLGGRSGLRGRCVQPCRRIYTQGKNSGRFFSCLDFSLDVLAKTLLPVGRIAAWKIEGRKKGAHYVYYTTTAYRLLRDHGDDPAAKREAQGFLEQALGRKTTHYNFLPQRPYPPCGQEDGTGSGLFVGRVRGRGAERYFSPRVDLMAGDLLRIGYEDRPGHGLCRVRRFVPARGRFVLNVRGAKPVTGSPVLLIDRLEKELKDKISELALELSGIPKGKTPLAGCSRTSFGKRVLRRGTPREVSVYRTFPRRRPGHDVGVWLSIDNEVRLSRRSVASTWFWLPPVVWQDDESLWRRRIDALTAMGAARFVLNSPWQVSFFKPGDDIELWAGPFCNQANTESIGVLEQMGFGGVIVSPELSLADCMRLPETSPLPLGMVLWGNWPLCVARTKPPGVRQNSPFASPRGERAWAVWRDSLVWLYPDRIFDARSRAHLFEKSGFSLFVHLVEPLPKGVYLKKSTCAWNLDSRLP